MGAGIGILLLMSSGVPAVVGCLGLALALDVFLSGAGIHLGIAQVIVVGSVLLSIPLAAFLAGIFFDSFVGNDEKGNVFSVFLPTFACALMLSGTGWIDYFSAALGEAGTVSMLRHSALFTASVSAACFCAALSAFVMLVADVLFEVPVRWLEGILRARVDLAIAAARPLLIVLGLSLALNLIMGLLTTELWPSTIAARLLGA